MENYNLQNQYSFSNQIDLPNATAVLVLGILSIVTCFCYGLPGLICGIIALVLAGKSMRMYEEEPEAYTISSYNNLKAGKICAIVGVSMAGLIFLAFLAYIIFIGTIISSILPWDQF